MEAKELPMLTEVSPLHKLNALLSMEVTELLMSIEVRPVQLENAEFPMEVTVFGMTVFMQPAIKTLVLVMMMALQLFRESYTVFSASTTICPKLSQPLNTLCPMEVTELGMVIVVRPSQSLNAPIPMEINELGRVIDVRLVQLENA